MLTKPCKRFSYLILALKSLSFICKLIATNFYTSNYILNAVDKRNKSKIKNLDKETLYNSKSRIKFLYVKLDMVTKIFNLSN